ncbi:Endonuclease/Exonuclease/phosphatase family protein [Halpernia humi]|uniref:Endonuclease/Exonuclease/phosphatase family protein n=1 Tax=Halpernia humi TaxID=493375 RepID=A0A1H6B3G2_9FLAO|nr:endonuclease/exonuclease/phosphatase family protein [Halpernia humi]SEG55140.1 Endonuclease/Exonuclease/phosphatase family protein [Halpernia humi]
MKIISWNVERPKINQFEKINFIENIIKENNADLIFLRETNSILNFGKEYFKLESNILPEFFENQTYFKGENRVTIYSKYEILEEIKTYDNFTCISGKIKTEFGELVLFGSIIGSFGGRDQYFKNDLLNQKKEIENLKSNICFSGDFNISFSGFKYPSKVIVSETMKFFEDNDLAILTKENKDCAIHIVLNNEFLKDKIYTNKMIEIDRKFSDHNLVICEISANKKK